MNESASDLANGNSEQSQLGAPNAARAVLVAGAAVLALLGVRATQDFLAPALLAFVFVVTAYPLQAMLVRRGWRPVWAMLVMLAVVYAVIAAFAVVLIISLAQMVQTLPQYSDELQQLIDDVMSAVGATAGNTDLSSVDLGKVAQIALGVVNGIVGSLWTVFLLVAVIFFLGLDGLGLASRERALQGHSPALAAGWGRWAHQTRRYIALATVFGVIVAVLDYGVLIWLGVPLALTWALLAFVTNYIPNIGFVIGVIPPALMALLDSGWQTAAWVIAAYCLINFTVQELIQPKLVGDAVGLATTVTFIAVLFWTLIIGPLGAILAVPMTIFVHQVLLAAYPGTRWLADAVSSGEPVDAGEATLDARETVPPEPEAASAG